MPGSPILVSAVGSDLDATVFHQNPAALGFEVSVEDLVNRESDRDSEKSEDPYFDSFADPMAMAGPAGLDDLIMAMRDMMRIQAQQLAQTVQLQQQLAGQQLQPPVVGQVVPPPNGRPAPQTGVTKIRLTLPIFDGSGDADDHMDLFLSIANAEG